MNTFKSSNSLLRLALVVGLLGGLAASPSLAGPPTDTPSTNSVPVKTDGPAPVKRQLTGAELYSIHCNRCHAERYPTERTGAQWKTIMLHMQVRANIPGQQARLILQYLQENSGR